MRTNRLARITSLTAALLLGLSAAASATELWGGPLVPSGDLRFPRFLRCEIVNVGDKPIDVTIEIFDAEGVTVAGPAVTSVDPREIADESVLGGFFPRTCKFSGSFSKSKVRATVSILDLTDGAVGTTAAVEAH